MVERVTGHGQSPPLHGVREHDARSVGHGVALAIGVDQHGEVVAAEVLDQARDPVVVPGSEEFPEFVVGSVQEVLAQVGSAAREQRLVFLVRHVVDPGAQTFAPGPGEGVLEE